MILKTRLLIFLALLLPLAYGQQAPRPEAYDILLKNGRVLDPAGKREGRLDIGIIGNRIARIAPDLPAAAARTAIDASGCYVSARFVDIQAHVDAQGAWRSVNPDHHSLRSGVTTVVDAGSTGYKAFESFKTRVIDRAQTRVLAFLNIASGGIQDGVRGTPVEELDAGQAALMAQKYPDVIVGILASLGDEAGGQPLERAFDAASRSGRIVMAHFFGAAARYDKLLERLRSGDIVTGIYGARTPLLDAQKTVRAPFREARKRGVMFDLGHGAVGFWFRIAAPAVAQRFLPDTISSAIDKESALLERANLAVTLSKLLNLGMTLEQLVECATVRPARAIGRPELAALREDAVADVAVFEIERGRFAMLDSGHAKLLGDRNLRVVLTVRAGRVVWDPDSRSRPDWLTAGPYSNYR